MAELVGCLFIVFSCHVNSQINFMKYHSMLLFLLLSIISVKLCYIYLHRLAKIPPIDKNKMMIFLTSIEKHLSMDGIITSSPNIVGQMLAVLTDFEVIKGQLKAFTRHQLRDRFLRLLTNRALHLKHIIGILANHSYKLPEGIFLFFIVSYGFSLK